MIGAGAALRLTTRSAFGLTLNADILQSIGSGSPRPRLLTLGLGLNIATDGPTGTGR